MHSARYSCQILTKLEFPRQIFAKKLRYQIKSKYIQWKPTCYTRTEGQTAMKKLIVAFRNFANMPTDRNKKPPITSGHTTEMINA
jgi:hypothetical protein